MVRRQSSSCIGSLAPAIGGIVVGFEVGRQLSTETISAERFNDKLILRRDFSIPKYKKVLIVEDVITTGKSAIECLEIVKDSGANLLGYACIIDRSDDNLSFKDSIISQLKFKIEIYKEEEIPSELKKIPAIKPGSRNL